MRTAPKSIIQLVQHNLAQNDLATISFNSFKRGHSHSNQCDGAFRGIFSQNWFLCYQQGSTSNWTQNLGQSRITINTPVKEHISTHSAFQTRKPHLCWQTGRINDQISTHGKWAFKQVFIKKGRAIQCQISITGDGQNWRDRDQNFSTHGHSNTAPRQWQT